MKLLDLELMVAALRAHAGASANPDITFYKNRTDADAKAGPLESDYFINFDIDAGEDISQTIWNHKVVAASSNVVPQKGDFELPLKVIPFYKA